MMNKFTTITMIGTLALVGLSYGVQVASAQVEFDQNVTPDVIFGSGNSNGNFTTHRANGVEIGLRAKIPFVGTTNSNGDGTYSYTLLETDHDSNAATANRWNFDWTVNTDFDGTSGLKVDDFTYELGMDGNPGLGTTFAMFDPITVPYADHSFGDNSTANGAGVEALNDVGYSGLTASSNVVQQSWRYSFFAALLPAYDPAIPGTYAVYLLARDGGGSVVARVDIQVLIGGAPPAGPNLSCEGFAPPLNTDVSVKKANRVLPLKMTLLDGSGTPQTSSDLTASPVLQVIYTGPGVNTVDLADLDTSGKGDDGNMFVYADGVWGFNMKTKGLASGAYEITVVSGDPGEYLVAPTCAVNLTVQ